MHIQVVQSFFCCIWRLVEGVFGFYYKGKPLFECMQEGFFVTFGSKIVLNPNKVILFIIFHKFLHHEGNFRLLRPLKIICTFHLKHLKHPICILIFHPISETESSAVCRAATGKASHSAKYNVSHGISWNNTFRLPAEHYLYLVWIIQLN